MVVQPSSRTSRNSCFPLKTFFKHPLKGMSTVFNTYTSEQKQPFSDVKLSEFAPRSIDRRKLEGHRVRYLLICYQGGYIRYRLDD